MKKFISKLLKLQTKQAIYYLKIRNKNIETKIPYREGQNLMDVTNKIINENANIYGLCDKQLACTTCSVEILSHYDNLKKPTEQQIDVLENLPFYQNKKTRMACQIYLQKNMDGMIINISTKNTIP